MTEVVAKPGTVTAEQPKEIATKPPGQATSLAEQPATVRGLQGQIPAVEGTTLTQVPGIDPRDVPQGQAVPFGRQMHMPDNSLGPLVHDPAMAHVDLQSGKAKEAQLSSAEDAAKSAALAGAQPNPLPSDGKSPPAAKSGDQPKVDTGGSEVGLGSAHPTNADEAAAR